MFQKGDIIHRTGGVTLNTGEEFVGFVNSYTDRSFIENPIRFLALQSNIMFYQYVASPGLDPQKVHRAAVDHRLDDCWDYWPMDTRKRLEEELDLQDRARTREGNG